jgi:hypothetical protein
MRERTGEGNIHNLIKNGRVVLIKGKQKYFKHDDYVIPVTKSESGINIIRTVLGKDMEVYDIGK